MTLYPADGEVPLTVGEVRARLQKYRSLWTWVGEDTGGIPCIRPQDSLQFVPPGESPTGLAVIDSDGLATLAVAARPSQGAPVAWVGQVWRGGRRYRLGRPPWRQLLRFGAGGRVWAWADGAFRVAHHAHWLRDQLRPLPTPNAVEAALALFYSMPGEIEFYAGTAGAGLWETEELLAERHLCPGDALLDIGCGAGREAFGFAKRGLRVTGVDLSSELIAHARREARSLSCGREVSFEVKPLSEIDFPAATFDAVLISSDLYATMPGRANRIRTLGRCRRMVRPGGLIIFPASISSGSSLRVRLLVDGPRWAVRWLLRGRVPEAGDRWGRSNAEESAPLVFRHTFFDESEVLSEIEAAGLAVVDRVSTFFVTRAPQVPAIAEGGDGRRYRRREDVVAEVVENELVLVQLAQGTTFRLNGTGKRIWEFADDGLTVSEIAERLCMGYGISAERLKEDASALLTELVENELLKVEETQ